MTDTTTTPPEEEKIVVVAAGLDTERIGVLLDLIEACSRVRGPDVIAINGLCMWELAQHGLAAQQELDAIAKEEAEKKAEEEAKAKEEEYARLKAEEEANKPAEPVKEPA